MNVVERNCFRSALSDSGIFDEALITAIEHAINLRVQNESRKPESIIKSCHRRSRNEMMNRIGRGC